MPGENPAYPNNNDKGIQCNWYCEVMYYDAGKYHILRDSLFFLTNACLKFYIVSQ